MSLYRFEDHLIDPRARRLSRAGHDIAVEPRVFDVIVYLIEQRERAVGRDELIAAVWGRVDSSDATLAQAILKARRVLDDDGHAQRAIRTVARFGYQWVAAIEPVTNEPSNSIGAEPEVEPIGRDPAPLHAQVGTAPPRHRRRAALALGAGLAAIVLAAGAYLTWRSMPKAPIHAQPAGSARAVPGLILVAPAVVHSAVADDGWMRLGLMAMSADALRALPRHSIVPNETALAAAGHAANPPDLARLRAATGATTIVTLDARREHGRWHIEATLNGAGGSLQTVDAEADDAVAAAGTLATRLRDAFDPNARRETDVSPDVVATSARMQAAILEGAAGRAVEIADAAQPKTASAPEIVLLRAKAMNRIGRAREVAALLDPLIANAGSPAPPWLAPAWTTLGYSALVIGRREDAEQDFRRAIAAVADDPIEAGRAWRGLGNAEAARGRYNDAESSFLRAELELADTSDQLLKTHILDDLGSVAGRRGRLEEAIARYRAAAESAAQLGATEIELGARMNIALAEGELLRHRDALAAWRALLPRVEALDYPSMHVYAHAHVADALAESGSTREAAAELDALAKEQPREGTRDALEDVRLDVAGVERSIGRSAEASAAAAALAGGATAPDRRTTALAVLLESALDLGDGDGAARAAASLATPDPAAAPAVRASALNALARWHASRGENAEAQAAWESALALVRDGGSPREVRDVALPLATFEWRHEHLDAARSTAALVAPYADDDFAITLLLARLAAAREDKPRAATLYDRARALAGKRWTGALATEAKSVAVPTVAHAARAAQRVAETAR